MTRPAWKVPLVTAAVVVAVLIGQWLATTAWEEAVDIVLQVMRPSDSLFGQSGALAAIATLAGEFIRYALFGVGVFFSLRFIFPIRGTDSWRRVVIGGIVATALGTAAVFILAILEIGASTFSFGSHPFGYALVPSVDPGGIGYGVVRGLESILNPFVTWLPLGILACVFLKLWLERNSAATGPASPAGKP